MAVPAESAPAVAGSSEIAEAARRGGRDRCRPTERRARARSQRQPRRFKRRPWIASRPRRLAKKVALAQGILLGGLIGQRTRRTHHPAATCWPPSFRRQRAQATDQPGCRNARRRLPRRKTRPKAAGNRDLPTKAPAKAPWSAAERDPHPAFNGMRKHHRGPPAPEQDDHSPLLPAHRGGRRVRWPSLRAESQRRRGEGRQ